MNDAEARREEVPENEVSQWIQAAQQWLLLDEDPTNQDVLRSLIAQQEAQELSELFGGGRLSFGTAGIRAAVGAGPLRMNTVVVRQTVAGICRWLDEKLGGETPAKIAIGHDARTHSEGFARIAAAECAAHGHEVMTWDEALPTPLVAFATKRRGADVGLVITASHNPATDNGLKVYLGGRLGNGRQLNTPDDGEIALAIEAELQENTQENGQNNAESIFQEESKIRINSGAALQQQYCDDVVQNLAPSGGHVPFVYTAVHGVGHSTFGKLLERAGFTGMIPVEEQCQPDGTFPTAPRPNPEIAGVLDLAMAAAQDAGVDVIIAHDPDADRCAVAVHQEAAKDGDENTFRRLSGDELGLALAAWLMQTGRLSDGAVASTLVSHSVLPELAAAHGLTWVQTLTGFKWLAAVPHVRFAYEEAIGYCLLPDVVADKDGLSAALGVVELVHWLAQRDQTLPGYLQELADQYGYTASSQMTVPLAAGVNPLAAVSGFQVPDTLADLSVTERKNLATKMGPLPPTPGMVYQAGEQPGQGVRLIVRPSGTEPLLKIYLHVWAPTARQSETLLELLENDVRQLM